MSCRSKGARSHRGTEGHFGREPGDRLGLGDPKRDCQSFCSCGPAWPGFLWFCVLLVLPCSGGNLLWLTLPASRANCHLLNDYTDFSWQRLGAHLSQGLINVPSRNQREMFPPARDCAGAPAPPGWPHLASSCLLLPGPRSSALRSSMSLGSQLTNRPVHGPQITSSPRQLSGGLCPLTLFLPQH